MIGIDSVGTGGLTLNYTSRRLETSTRTAAFVLLFFFIPPTLFLVGAGIACCVTGVGLPFGVALLALGLFVGYKGGSMTCDLFKISYGMV